jgi:hypothetical protein
VDELPPAEEFPALYRAILDRVDRLERAGDRQTAARLRIEATRAYSAAWDASHRRQLEGVKRRVDRALTSHVRSGAAGLRAARRT